MLLGLLLGGEEIACKGADGVGEGEQDCGWCSCLFSAVVL